MSDMVLLRWESTDLGFISTGIRAKRTKKGNVFEVE